ncbi:hypothetical protein VTO73DRAFT_13445 [Trametes versicolor]
MPARRPLGGLPRALAHASRPTPIFSGETSAFARTLPSPSANDHTRVPPMTAGMRCAQPGLASERTHPTSVAPRASAHGRSVRATTSFHLPLQVLAGQSITCVCSLHDHQHARLIAHRALRPAATPWAPRGSHIPGPCHPRDASSTVISQPLEPAPCPLGTLGTHLRGPLVRAGGPARGPHRSSHLDASPTATVSSRTAPQSPSTIVNCTVALARRTRRCRDRPPPRTAILPSLAPSGQIRPGPRKRLQ